MAQLQKIAPWWFRIVVIVFNHRGLAALATFLAIFSTLELWSHLNHRNGTSNLGYSVIAALLGTVLLASALSLARWQLLFWALKGAVRKLPQEWFNTFTVLVSGGAGGALAVGLLSKTLHQLGRPVPKSFVIDLDYVQPNRIPQIGTVLQRDSFISPPASVVLVGSFCGTGQSLEQLREYLRLPPECRTFVFIMGEDVRDHHVQICLVQGRHRILPWQRSPRLTSHRQTLASVASD